MNHETRRAKEHIARCVQRGLEEAGLVPPGDVGRRPLEASKLAPIEQMEIPPVLVTDADVLKYGRRVAMLLATPPSE